MDGPSSKSLNDIYYSLYQQTTQASPVASSIESRQVINFSPQLINTYQLPPLKNDPRFLGTLIDYSSHATAVSYENAVYLFINDEVKIFHLPSHISKSINDSISCIKWISNDKLAVGTLEGALHILDIRNFWSPWGKSFDLGKSIVSMFNLTEETLLICPFTPSGRERVRIQYDNYLFKHHNIVTGLEDYQLSTISAFPNQGLSAEVFSQSISKNKITITRPDNNADIVTLCTDNFQPIAEIAKSHLCFINNNCIAWDPTERFIAYPNYEKIEIWDSQTKELALVIPVMSSVSSLWWINDVLFCTHGSDKLGTIYNHLEFNNGKILSWQINKMDKTATLLQATQAHDGGILRATLSNDKKTMITYGSDSSIKWWDISATNNSTDT